MPAVTGRDVVAVLKRAATHHPMDIVSDSSLTRAKCQQASAGSFGFRIVTIRASDLMLKSTQP